MPDVPYSHFLMLLAGVESCVWQGGCLGLPEFLFKRAAGLGFMMLSSLDGLFFIPTLPDFLLSP